MLKSLFEQLYLERDVDTSRIAWDMVDVDARDPNKLSLLTVACAQGHYRVVRELLVRGACRDMSCEEGPSLLALAAGAPRCALETLEVLYAAGERSVNAVEGEFFGPLYYACEALANNRKTTCDVVWFLLEAGADPLQCATNKKYSPMRYVCEVGCERAMACFLQSKTVSVNSMVLVDGELRRPLNIATDYAHENLVRLLIAHGADVDYHEGDRKTATYYAAKFGFRAIVRLLLLAGAEPPALELFTSIGFLDDDIEQMILDAGTRRVKRRKY